MVAFVIGKPQRTQEPTVLVDAGLKPGRHRFRLVGVDDRGLDSAPDEWVVEVSDTTVPQGATAATGATRRRSRA